MVAVTLQQQLLYVSSRALANAGMLKRLNRQLQDWVFCSSKMHSTLQILPAWRLQAVAGASLLHQNGPTTLPAVQQMSP